MEASDTITSLDSTEFWRQILNRTTAPKGLLSPTFPHCLRPLASMVKHVLSLGTLIHHKTQNHVALVANARGRLFVP